MEQRSYGLRCACGEAVRVTAGDAGTRVGCVCGGTVEVPSLRALRADASEPVQPTDSTEHEARRPEREVARHRWMAVAVGFVVTLALFVLFMPGLHLTFTPTRVGVAWWGHDLYDGRVEIDDRAAFPFALLCTVAAMLLGGLLCVVIGWAVGKAFGWLLGSFRAPDPDQ